MQPIIINNIKQAPSSDVRRQEIIYYKLRAREWRNDGRNYIITIILIFNGRGGREDDTGDDELGE